MVAKRPPTYSVVPALANALTVPGVNGNWSAPVPSPPSADQVVPFQVARLAVATEPALVKFPPTSSVEPTSSSAATLPERSGQPTQDSTPPPRTDQLVPFQVAML